MLKDKMNADGWPLVCMDMLGQVAYFHAVQFSDSSTQDECIYYGLSNDL